MEAVTGVPVSVYLATAYRPDREYVEGEVIERNVGEFDHGRLQALLSAFLLALEKQVRIVVAVETRVQVRPDRFRVPDVCVLNATRRPEQIITTPPLICIEILSPEDRMAQMQDRIADYLAFGVPHVWILNPRAQTAFVCTRDGMQEVRDGILRTDAPPIELPVAELFAGLSI